MADEKPLTIPGLIAALKEAGFATKGDLDEKLEALRKRIDSDQFEARTEFFVKMTKPEIKKVRKAMQEGVSQIDKRLERLESEVHWIKDDIKGLESDLSLAPTRARVSELEERVDALETASTLQ